MPNDTAATQPTKMPITGPHSRMTPLARSTMSSVATMVAPAVTGAASDEAPSGTWRRRSNRRGMIVTAMSMITVPATTGVMIRLRSARCRESPNWKREEAMTSDARRAGPPSTSAVTEAAMNAPDVPMRRTYPAPMRPMRAACTAVVTPLTIRTAKLPHDR